MSESFLQSSPADKTDGVAVVLEGVFKRFGTTTAVDNASLSVPAGSVYGLIGPNGAGKTTTFSMICGYLKPTSGTVRVLGAKPRDLRALKGRRGALPQDALLPANDSVLEVVAFYARLLGNSRPRSLELAREALARVGMGEWLKVRCGALSHGMAKRVGLAQAFLGDPELVLLDEPTAGLDPKSAFQLREFIKQRRREGNTIVISSHNLTELEELCDGAAILDRGRVVAAGTMAELTRSIGEVRISVAADALPMQLVRELKLVTSAEFDASRRTLVIGFAPSRCEAEDVIGETLQLLLAQGVKISGVAKGRKLEERVMELT